MNTSKTESNKDKEKRIREQSGNDQTLVRVPRTGPHQKVHLRAVNHSPTLTAERTAYGVRLPDGPLNFFAIAPAESATDPRPPTIRYGQDYRAKAGETLRSLTATLLALSGLTRFDGLDLSLDEQIGLFRGAARGCELTEGVPLQAHLHFLRTANELSAAQSELLQMPPVWAGKYRRHAICLMVADAVLEGSLVVSSQGGRLALPEPPIRGGWGEVIGPFLVVFFLVEDEPGKVAIWCPTVIPILSETEVFPVESHKERVIYKALRRAIRWAACAGADVGLHKQLHVGLPGTPGAGERLDGILHCGDRFAATEILGIARVNYINGKRVIIDGVKDRDGIPVHEFNVPMGVGEAGWDDAVATGLRAYFEWLFECCPALRDRDKVMRAMLGTGMLGP